MTSLSDFPPDVQAAAERCFDSLFGTTPSEAMSVIASAIIADRAGRKRPKIGGLTAHQRRVFEYLATFMGLHGVAPSYGEIQAHLGLASKSGVQRVIIELEERGVISRLPHRSRAITIIATPTAGASHG